MGNYYSGLTGDIKGVRIGVPDTFYFERIEPEVEDGVRKAIDGLKDLGAEVRPVYIPDLEEAATATLLILSSEATSCLEKFHCTRPSDIGDDVRARIDIGALHLATHYIKAQRIRRITQENFSRVLKRVNVLVTPGASITAPRREDSTVRLDTDDVTLGVALTRCSRIYNLVGLPSVSVPVGLSQAGLPIGIQIAGRLFDEKLVLRVAAAYERSLYQPRQWPDLA